MRKPQEESITRGNFLFRGTRPVKFKGGVGAVVYKSKVSIIYKMSDPATHEATRLLADWAKGNEQALDDLTPLVYQELRRLAASYLRKERQGHTLQPTASSMRPI